MVPTKAPPDPTGSLAAGMPIQKYPSWDKGAEKLQPLIAQFFYPDCPRRSQIAGEVVFSS